ncbi:hypothetical protein [Yinghuangia sp. YIM S09857]|uniref:hypothetical protein n=1 Tax=Yinghuangia sp. YIM S09857 TaxID=3436929 RepID=UPI003F53B445
MKKPGRRTLTAALLCGTALSLPGAAHAAETPKLAAVNAAGLSTATPDGDQLSSVRPERIVAPAVASLLGTAGPGA